MKKIILPALLATLLVACGSTGTKTTGAGTDGASVSDSSISRGQSQSGPSSTGMAALTDPNNILSVRSVYFDFDSFSIKREFAPMVEAHADFLRQNSQMRVLLQGNTDERGSREYNLALGQKRAEALKRALTLLGVSENQIEAVSLGEEKPRCAEQNETCWGENRRSDILYSGEF